MSFQGAPTVVFDLEMSKSVEGLWISGLGFRGKGLRFKSPLFFLGGAVLMLEDLQGCVFNASLQNLRDPLRFGV